MPVKNIEKIKVGIIEDDPMVSQINRKYTEKVDGFKVEKEINLDKGMDFEISSLQELDLILLDIFLPQKSGIEILEEIRKISSEIDVIIISASKDVEHINRCLKLGVIDYLIKPFTIKRFKKALNKYLNVKYKMQAGKELKQNDIDNLINQSYSTVDKSAHDRQNIVMNFGKNLPKGLSQKTLDKVIRCLKENCKVRLSSHQIGSIMGLSRVTAQRYLKFLEKEGFVKMEVDYGTVGRPKHYYILK